MSTRTYEVRTYGCQMNVHDSERIGGVLEAAGYALAADPNAADVVVFNTCAVRENADNRLYGNLGHLVPRKGNPPVLEPGKGATVTIPFIGTDQESKKILVIVKTISVD